MGIGAIVTATTGSPFTPTVGAGNDPLGTGFNGDFSMDYPDFIKGCNLIHGGVNYLNTGFASPCQARRQRFATGNCVPIMP